jgi:hypothetical protein
LQPFNKPKFTLFILSLFVVAFTLGCGETSTVPPPTTFDNPSPPLKITSSQYSPPLSTTFAPVFTSSLKPTQSNSGLPQMVLGDLKYFNNGQPFSGKPVTQFTNAPVDLNSISQIIPLGACDSGAAIGAGGAGAHNIPTDHMYPSYINRSIPNPLYMVADGNLIKIDFNPGRWEPPSGQSGKLDDYGMLFQFSETLFLEIGHLTQIAPEIRQTLGTLHEGSNYFNLPLKAGTLLGSGGGSPMLGTFDFWAWDFNSKPHFVSPLRYGTGAYCVSPIDYYPEPLKTQLTNLLPERAAPRAGSYDYDIDGKLVGNWFLVTSDDKLVHTPLLSFCYDNLKPSQVEIGDSLVGKVWKVVNNTPDPATIDATSGLVKFVIQDKSAEDKDAFIAKLKSQGLDQSTIDYKMSAWTPPPSDVMMVQMLAPRKIKMELFSGTSPSQIMAFTDKAIEFER